MLKVREKICQVTNDKTNSIIRLFLVIYLELDRFVKKSVDTNGCHLFLVLVLKKMYKSISKMSQYFFCLLVSKEENFINLIKTLLLQRCCFLPDRLIIYFHNLNRSI